MSCLKIEGVSKHFGSVAALDTVDLEVAAGSRTAIVGPSGSGKTTLLRIIAGFETPDSGRVVLGDDVLANGAALVPAHRRGIGLVSQDGALFPHLSIADNVGFGLDRRDANRAGRIAELMTMVELDLSMLPRKPDQLSGGQQQRVALARALARKPRLMLLDEPFSALDTGLRASTRKAVAELLSRAGITTILVTHDQPEALSFADQVAVMRGGQLPQVGIPQDVYLRPKDAMIAEFLGDAIVLPAHLGEGCADCPLGRLATRHSRHAGMAEIMLRPEQISIAPADGEGTDRSASLGEVIDVDFSGPHCTVAVRLLQEDGQPVRNGAVTAPLLLRRSSLGVPAVGARVRIRVTGPVHVFD